MTGQHVDLSDGTSIVAAVLGRRWQLPKAIADHPQVALYGGDDPTAPKFPPNLKAIAYADGLSLQRTQFLKDEAKKRDVVYVSRSNSMGMIDLLNLWIGTAPKKPTENGAVAPGATNATPADGDPKKQMAPRGAIPDLIKELVTKQHVNEATAALGRMIFDEAKRRGITTTIGSCEQAVRLHKKRLGAGDTPLSAIPQAERERLQVLRTFDDALAGLQLTRDWIAAAEAENTELKALKAKLKGMLGD